jgi:hypothetical protein
LQQTLLQLILAHEHLQAFESKTNGGLQCRPQHWPPRQVSLAAQQALPHCTVGQEHLQANGSSTHGGSQCRVQGVHLPATQVSPVLHFLRHPPQLKLSTIGSVQ